MGESTLNDAQDIAEGFNEYFSNIGPDLASKIDTSSCNFRNWLMANKLSLNVAKTDFMLIGSKRMIKNFHPNIIIENKQIKQSL
jgi:hypothetical protein